MIQQVSLRETRGNLSHICRRRVLEAGRLCWTGCSSSQGAGCRCRFPRKLTKTPSNQVRLNRRFWPCCCRLGRRAGVTRQPMSKRYRHGGLAHQSGHDPFSSDQVTGCKASAHAPHSANAEREGCEAAPAIQRHGESPEAKTIKPCVWADADTFQYIPVCKTSWG